MSQQNLELAHRILDGLGEQRDAEKLLALAHPDVEWHSIFAIGSAGVYRGHEGTLRYMSDLNDAWEVGHAEVDDGLALDDVVVLVGRIYYRGRESGVAGEAPVGWVFKFRDGKLTYFRAFQDPAAALAALGAGA